MSEVQDRLVETVMDNTVKEVLKTKQDAIESSLYHQSMFLFR